MNYSEINKILSSKIKHNELVEFFRSEIDDISMLGNVISISSSHVLLEYFSDFQFDGYKIIRNRDVSDVVVCDKNESLGFINMICKKENLFSKDPITVDIKNWNSVFDFALKNKVPISVECAFEDAIDYYFGTVVQIEGNLAVMQCFDGSGILFKDKIKVNLNFVSSLSIGDRYISYMSKYANK